MVIRSPYLMRHGQLLALVARQAYGPTRVLRDHTLEAAFAQ